MPIVIEHNPLALYTGEGLKNFGAALDQERLFKLKERELALKEAKTTGSSSASGEYWQRLAQVVGSAGGGAPAPSPAPEQPAPAGAAPTGPQADSFQTLSGPRAPYSDLIPQVVEPSKVPGVQFDGRLTPEEVQVLAEAPDDASRKVALDLLTQQKTLARTQQEMDVVRAMLMSDVQNGLYSEEDAQTIAQQLNTGRLSPEQFVEARTEMLEREVLARAHAEEWNAALVQMDTVLKSYDQMGVSLAPEKARQVFLKAQAEGPFQEKSPREALRDFYAALVTEETFDEAVNSEAEKKIAALLQALSAAESAKSSLAPLEDATKQAVLPGTAQPGAKVKEVRPEEKGPLVFPLRSYPGDKQAAVEELVKIVRKRVSDEEFMKRARELGLDPTDPDLHRAIRDAMID